MNAAPNVERPDTRVDNPAPAQGQRQTPLPKPWRQFLVAYWALAIPRDARIMRVAFLQPFTGIMAVVAGSVMSVWGWTAHAVAFGVGGIALAVLGAVLAGTAYWISVLYFQEYPGGFSAYLEEYVARRVSRLSRNDFIPRYKAQDPDAAKVIRVMNDRVSLALQGELLRLAQSEHSGEPDVCGVLVVGPKHSNKTGALWDAMKLHLREWTFVRWPHHMDYPPDLASHLGHRIVLWLDDLHDFANLGEAAALDQFIQELRDKHGRFLVLASCRDGDDRQEVRRYFRPLINTLRRVPALPLLKLETKSDDLHERFENDLTDSQQSVLKTIDWLESQQVNTFPWEALIALNTGFLTAAATLGGSEETLKGLANDSANRFVQVNQRADPQTALGGERYDFWRWFRYTFQSRRYTRRHRNDHSEGGHFVIQPINVNNLALSGSEDVGTGQTASILQEMAHTLEQHPEVAVKQLSSSPFAAETLILLGDAYLYRLEETVENAGELAVLCYDGALKALNQDEFASQFPGAWAAAHVGKGNAALRARRLSEDAHERASKLSAAATEYEEVTQRGTATVPTGARPIPRMSIAHAWHGKGDAIAATIPSEMAAQDASGGALGEFVNAATFFAKAANALPLDDPLQNEARLDRANVLYVIARVSNKRFQASLSSTAPSDTPVPPPIGAINDAQEACQKVQDIYGKPVAPAVYAELQRRLGDLCLIQTEWLVPADKRSTQPHFSAATRDMLASYANEQVALTMAKSARDYFTEACDIFAPSYLPMSWLAAQIGLIRAQLIIARLLASDDPDTARDLYRRSLSMTETAMEQLARRAHSPLDWVDLQLLRAQGEIGIGRLDSVNASAQFTDAKTTLGEVKRFLESYTLVRVDMKSVRTAAQQTEAELLSAEIDRAK